MLEQVNSTVVRLSLIIHGFPTEVTFGIDDVTDIQETAEYIRFISGLDGITPPPTSTGSTGTASQPVQTVQPVQNTVHHASQPEPSDYTPPPELSAILNAKAGDRGICTEFAFTRWTGGRRLEIFLPERKYPDLVLFDASPMWKVGYPATKGDVFNPQGLKIEWIASTKIRSTGQPYIDVLSVEYNGKICPVMGG